MRKKRKITPGSRASELRKFRNSLDYLVPVLSYTRYKNGVIKMTCRPVPSRDIPKGRGKQL